MWNKLVNKFYNLFFSDNEGVEDDSREILEEANEGFVVLSVESEEDAMLKAALEESGRLYAELRKAQEEAQELADRHDAVSSMLARPLTFAYGRKAENLDDIVEAELAELEQGTDLDAEFVDAEFAELEIEFGLASPRA